MIVCVYVYVYLRIYIYIYICIHTYVHTHICIFLAQEGANQGVPLITRVPGPRRPRPKNPVKRNLAIRAWCGLLDLRSAGFAPAQRRKLEAQSFRLRGSDSRRSCLSQPEPALSQVETPRALGARSLRIELSTPGLLIFSLSLSIYIYMYMYIYIYIYIHILVLILIILTIITMTNPVGPRARLRGRQGQGGARLPGGGRVRRVWDLQASESFRLPRPSPESFRLPRASGFRELQASESFRLLRPSGCRELLQRTSPHMGAYACPRSGATCRPRNFKSHGLNSGVSTPGPTLKFGPPETTRQRPERSAGGLGHISRLRSHEAAVPVPPLTFQGNSGCPKEGIQPSVETRA